MSKTKVLIAVCIGIGALLTLLWWLAHWWPALDIVNNGLPVLAAGAALLLGLALIIRDWHRHPVEASHPGRRPHRPPRLPPLDLPHAPLGKARCERDHRRVCRCPSDASLSCRPTGRGYPDPGAIRAEEDLAACRRRRFQHDALDTKAEGFHPRDGASPLQHVLPCGEAIYRSCRWSPSTTCSPPATSPQSPYGPGLALAPTIGR